MEQELGIRQIPISMHVFKEDEVFVAHAPEPDVSSCGGTEQAAREALTEAVRAFLEASADMGTLEAVLKESGYRRERDHWQPPKLVSFEQVTLTLR